MSDVLNQPKSVSNLQPTKFSLQFSRLPDVQYFVQRFNIPGISMPMAIQPTPFINRKMPGNKVEYEELMIEFLVAEDLNGWFEIWTWLKAIGEQNSTVDYANLKTQSNKTFATPFPQYSDCHLTVLSTQNNPKRIFQFHDCFPISLSGIDFDTTKNAEEIITATARFGFLNFDYLTTV